MSQAALAVSEMNGCELYLVQQAASDEDQILVTELWSSAPHHKASLQNPQIIALISQARPIIAGIDGKPATPLAAHGIGV